MKKRGIAVWLASGFAACGLLLLAGAAQERGTAIEWGGFIALVAGALCAFNFVGLALYWIYDDESSPSEPGATSSCRRAVL